MRSDADRLPHIGETARELGVQPDRDMPVDGRGFVKPITGSMSITADEPLKLPAHRRPGFYDRTGRDPIVEIAVECLATRLLLRQDGDVSHFLVEPLPRCPFGDCQATIQSICPSWLHLDP